MVLAGVVAGSRDPKPMGDAESLLQLRPARARQWRCTSDDKAYSRAIRSQLEILKFYIRITSTS
jgi:hypothetical protein